VLCAGQQGEEGYQPAGTAWHVLSARRQRRRRTDHNDRVTEQKEHKTPCNFPIKPHSALPLTILCKGMTSFLLFCTRTLVFAHHTAPLFLHNLHSTLSESFLSLTLPLEVSVDDVKHKSTSSRRCEPNSLWLSCLVLSSSVVAVRAHPWPSFCFPRQAVLESLLEEAAQLLRTYLLQAERHFIPTIQKP